MDNSMILANATAALKMADKLRACGDDRNARDLHARGSALLERVTLGKCVSYEEWSARRAADPGAPRG